MPPGTRYQAIAAGWAHSLALQKDGTVVAWGNNEDSQCDVPPEIQGRILAIAAGGSYSLAIVAEEGMRKGRN